FAGVKKNKSTKIPFKKASVQLATLTDKIPKGKDWIFEIKYDGYRIVSYVENGKVKMLTRNNLDYTKKFNDIAQNLKKIDQNSFVVDGEVVAFDQNGKSDFGLLQESIKKDSTSLCYCVFDLLALNGEDLRNLPLIERKAKLERLLFKSKNNLIYSSHVDNGKETFDFAKKNNLEGIIAKKKNSVYTGKRTDDWLKVKCYARQEFVIAGYTTSDKNTILSALLLGYYKNKKLVYAGKVGTGFDEKDRKSLVDAFQSSIVTACPFADNIKVNNAVWLKPKFVAEIQFAEFTKDNLLRQPSFVGLRSDKKSKDVVLEVKNGKNQNNKS
ncbi:MAG: non-homologous end-joining DNA ligase, partial [Clostridia bacterium]|nr:non-homologous end-joining DNA ligase [Clostridia bacterium]